MSISAHVFYSKDLFGDRDGISNGDAEEPVGSVKGKAESAWLSEAYMASGVCTIHGGHEKRPWVSPTPWIVRLQKYCCIHHAMETEGTF